MTFAWADNIPSVWRHADDVTGASNCGHAYTLTIIPMSVSGAGTPSWQVRCPSAVAAHEHIERLRRMTTRLVDPRRVAAILADVQWRGLLQEWAVASDGHLRGAEPRPAPPLRVQARARDWTVSPRVHRRDLRERGRR